MVLRCARDAHRTLKEANHRFPLAVMPFLKAGLEVIRAIREGQHIWAILERVRAHPEVAALVTLVLAKGFDTSRLETRLDAEIKANSVAPTSAAPATHPNAGP